MREPRIYVDVPLQEETRLQLPVEVSHYVSRVLRRRPGQRLWLFNGRGGYHEAEILSLDKRHVVVSMLAFHPPQAEPVLSICLVQGVSRSQHMDYTLQKAVELGVAKIVVLSTEFANTAMDAARLEKKCLHWQKIIISACEQCGRDRLPELSAPGSLREWLAMDDNRLKLLLQPGAGQGLSALPGPAGPLSILSGPEGGLSEAENEAAIASGYLPVGLGPRILRTETAALAAISICQSRWGDMG